MGEQLASLRPSEMVEGGAVPTDQNLRIESASFEIFDYQGKGKPTTALKLVLMTDEDVENVQYWSAADPSRFVPSDDKNSLTAVGTASSLSKSSNFAILMDNLCNAGFPEDQIGNDITVLEGLYAYWIGVPAPKRSGLEQKEGKVILVPSQIHEMPGGVKKPKSKAKPKPAAKKKAATPAPAEEEGDDDEIKEAAVEFIKNIVEEEGEITRQDLAVRVFEDLSDDEDVRDGIAAMIFEPELQALLLANGLKIKGEVISGK